MIEPHLWPSQTVLSVWTRAPDPLAPHWLPTGRWLAETGQRGLAWRHSFLRLQAHLHCAGRWLHNFSMWLQTGVFLCSRRVAVACCTVSGTPQQAVKHLPAWLRICMLLSVCRDLLGAVMTLAPAAGRPVAAVCCPLSAFVCPGVRKATSFGMDIPVEHAELQQRTWQQQAHQAMHMGSGPADGKQPCTAVVPPLSALRGN